MASAAFFRVEGASPTVSNHSDSSWTVASITCRLFSLHHSHNRTTYRVRFSTVPSAACVEYHAAKSVARASIFLSRTGEPHTLVGGQSFPGILARMLRKDRPDMVICGLLSFSYLRLLSNEI